MRTDALFIGIQVDDDAARDPALAAKLAEVCPVDIYAQRDDGGVRIVEENGRHRRVRICTRCLRSGKVSKAVRA